MIEIERKFLVKKELLPELSNGKTIIQGYLCIDPMIRFRIVNTSIIIGIKQALSDGSRFELETTKEHCTLEEFMAVQAMSVSPVIEKTRYRVEHQGLVWEIDVYARENTGLITVDVELPYIDYEIIFPKWVDSKADITNDPRYFNSNLGITPYEQW